MAKTTKKQQQRALKKQKERADKRRQLRYIGRAEAGTELAPIAFPGSLASKPEHALRAGIQAFSFQATCLRHQ